MDLIKGSKFIPGFSQMYKVTEQGDVISVPRISVHGKRIPLRILRKQVDKKGYYYVNLFYENRDYTRRIHILVGTLFIPNPDGHTIVGFKDGNKLNLRSDNLEWVSHKRYMVLRGRGYVI